MAYPKTIDDVCDELRRRADRNLPMDTEDTLRTLLIMAESIQNLVGKSAPVKSGELSAETPKEPQTIQRHL